MPDLSKKVSDACPTCAVHIVPPSTCHGMWDGRKPNGAKAGGGMYKLTCTGCGAKLVAYGDFYDELGKLREDVKAEPPLFWSYDA